MDLFEKVSSKQTNNKTPKQKHSKGAKKETHDLFVQGTNDSSIVSKRSVEMLYSLPVDNTTTQYFQHFVKKAPRRTPVINRGYWIRMRSIRMAVEKIIQQQPSNQRINIVNLGCGYDPLPFQLLDDELINKNRLFCIDIDYPELAGYKSQMIQMSPELLSITGNPTESKFCAFQTENYALLGCDLTNQADYIEKMDSFGANDITTTTIFIAEVSLAYMTPETANPIIETSSKFSNSHFLILEQLMPAGSSHPFAKRMLNHFKKMEAPLQCVETYPTIENQINRFKALGYKTARAQDLLGCWELVDEDLKQKVAKVEPFDEWEEFFYFGQHYINLHATNQVSVQVYGAEELHPYPELPSINGLNVKIDDNAIIERKFPSAFKQNESILVACGSNQSRLDSVVQYDYKTGSLTDFEITKPSAYKARMASSSVTVDDVTYLIGGRRMPGIGIDEMWKCVLSSENQSEWIRLNNLSSGRVKHTALQYQNGILMFGGVKNDDLFEFYSVEDDKWTKMTTNLSFSLESAEMVLCNDEIYLYGGFKHGDDCGSFEFNSALYRLEVSPEDNHVEAVLILTNIALARYGSKAVSLKDDVITVAGGVGLKCYSREDLFVQINIKTRKVSALPMDNLLWSIANPLVGFDLVQTSPTNAVLIAGGAVCYGFGSVWGKVLKLEA